MRILPAGDGAVLVETGGLDEVMALHDALRAVEPPGVVDLVPAATTVLVRFDPAVTGPARLAELLDGLRLDAPARGGAQPVDIPVRYDGEDLAEVARLTGLTEVAVVGTHCGATYRCAFVGFAPGFAYLTGLASRLHVPRRGTPRTRVPAGAVALADEFTAVYPRESPGGWHIIGHTDLPMWDASRFPPSTLTPGTPVRFVELP